MRRTSRGDRSDKMCKFLDWATSHIAYLRGTCSVTTIDDELTESELW
jgi:hypothetical protein